MKAQILKPMNCSMVVKLAAGDIVDVQGLAPR
jgi:hypothetical protein